MVLLGGLRLHDVLTRIGGSPINKIKDLLPQNWVANKK